MTVNRIQLSDDVARGYLAEAARVVLPAEDIAAAVGVLQACETADLDPLWTAVPTDGNGNPTPRTDEERRAWATWSSAHEQQDRARSLRLALEHVNLQEAG